MHTITVINGPNLNMLGKRDAKHYGNATLEQINQQLAALAKQANLKLDCFQSNSESELIIKLQSLDIKQTPIILINPAAFTHTSVALRDAILDCHIPFVEIHMSNIFGREEFRRHSYFADLAAAIIAGFGIDSYLLAMQWAINFVQTNNSTTTT